jgi:CDP-diacylglycerol---glycerol-3-phosphate 3-phosphatidyltransferase
VKARLKRVVRGLAAPVGEGLARLGISADAVTWAGVVAAGAAAWGFARGNFWLALGGLLLSGLCDLLDGAVARAGGRGGTSFGAALDSTLDRYGEGLILGALIVRAATQTQQPELRAVFAAVAVLAAIGSFLVSYVRARSEGLGIACEVGILERPERLALLVALAVWGDRGLPWILGALALLTHVTFAQRLVHVYRESKRRERTAPSGGGGRS